MADKKPDTLHLLSRAAAFAEYRPRLHRYLLKAIRNDTDVKDLMQEILIGFLKVPRETVIQDPAKYLFMIALNVLNQFFKKKSANPVMYDSESADGLICDVEDSGMCEAESKAVQQDLVLAIQQLPRAHFEVLRLKMETDLSYADIAQQLGMPENTVKKYLYIAKARLMRDTL